nr:immunoglobulin light chain junction region [Macaca mulatta]MOX75490.1 immunoglobulin light chain junction region [Macaca mulatta]MOX76072.1 immunoglobulin light chain junction region [Macaca mulatta]MOX76817.1 immunoglobulin light chain junction region [Macaca mulatta]
DYYCLVYMGSGIDVF